MKNAYVLLLSNYRNLVKKTYRTVLVFSVFLSITYYFFLPNKALHDWGLNQPWASFIIQTVVYLISLVSFIFYKRSMWRWVKHERFHIRFRYIGRFLALFALGIIIIACLACVLLLPTLILSASQLQSQIGALNGDALGVPAYFTPLLLITFVLTFFILSYLAAWLDMACIYLCGSVSMMEKERHQIKEDNQSYLNIKQ